MVVRTKKPAVKEIEKRLKRASRRGDQAVLADLIAKSPGILKSIIDHGLDKDKIAAIRVLAALNKADAGNSDSKYKTVAHQKKVLESLSQQVVASLLGVTARHIRDHNKGRKEDGTYDGASVVQWFVDKKIAEARKKWEQEKETLKSAKDRQEEAKAIKYEEEAKSVQDAYILRDEVLLDLQEIASAVRTELESLPRTMANDFPVKIRNKLVQELRNQVKQILRRLASRGSKLDGGR